MKKKILISICIVVSLILLTLATVLFFIIEQNNYSFSEGIFLKADGSFLIICENTPIVLSNRTKDENLFDSIKSGDKIRIVHDSVAESSPAQTGVYYCKKLSDGTMKDIPDEVIHSLLEMGWFKEGTDQTPDNTSEKKGPLNVDFTLGSEEFGICDTADRPDEEVKLIRNTEELKTHWDSVRNNYVLTDPTDKYNEEYFKNNYLLLVYVFGQSGMTEYTVEGIIKDGDTVTVNLQSYTPALHTDDCYATWLFFELSKDVDILNHEFVKVYINELEAFSYSDFLYSVDSNAAPGLRFDNFNNTKPCDATAKEKAIDLAKKELSMGFTYDTVDVAFDRFHTMWSVTFSTERTAGGCITVYLSTDGITKAIISGE